MNKNRGFATLLAAAVFVFMFLISTAFAGFSPPSLLVCTMLALLAAFVVFRVATRNQRLRQKILKTPFPKNWRVFLLQNVEFYTQLPPEKQTLFEKDIQYFIASTRISGIKTQIDDSDRLLVAASAVIPVFAFPGWEYDNLSEVLLYDGAFDENFQTGGGKNILGMVGSGAMNGMMILSKPALKQGFRNARDKKNVGIHEFVHLIDKADGTVDGVPEILLKNQYALPWIDLVEQQIQRIADQNSDINPYGATNRQEFFAVAAEYFFERPKLLKTKHPQLYQMLNRIFRQDLFEEFKKPFRKNKIGRNDPCPCGSGLKFKHCCLPNSRL